MKIQYSAWVWVYLFVYRTSNQPIKNMIITVCSGSFVHLSMDCMLGKLDNPSWSYNVLYLSENGSWVPEPRGKKRVCKIDFCRHNRGGKDLMISSNLPHIRYHRMELDWFLIKAIRNNIPFGYVNHSLKKRLSKKRAWKE